ncbi:MAG TPA: LLM class flavin-dependent oxidoreductase [Chloroflexota bacterium]
MSRFEVSVAFQSDEADYDALGKLVDVYDFDAVSVYQDLFFPPSIGPLLALARSTSRARLGPAALNPYTLHPVEIAGQIAQLDLASGGRAYLGLVRGSWLDALGLPQPKPITRLQETIAAVRYLLAGQRHGFDGQLFTIAPGARLLYEPVRRDVQIVLGTWGEQTARALGRLVDEVKVGGSTSPAMAQRMRSWLPPQTGLCLGAVTVVDHDRAAARARARQELALYLPVVAKLDVTLNQPNIDAHTISDDVLDRFAFAGTPDDILGQVAALRAAGATRIEFGTPHGLDSPSTGLQLLGEHVLPQLHR